MQPEFFRVSRDGPIAHIVLNRPEKANSLDNSFWVELPQILREMDHDPAVRVAILSGEGKHFSSGMDLSAFDFIGELVKAEPGRAAFGFRKEILRLQDALNAIEEVRFPVIGIAHGACIGGAIDLLAACDVCIASADAKFAIEEVNVGMAADVGTLQRLPKMMSPAVVKELAYSGRRFSPEEAKQWGFVTDKRDRICGRPHHSRSQCPRRPTEPGRPSADLGSRHGGQPRTDTCRDRCQDYVYVRFNRIPPRGLFPSRHIRN